MAKSLYSFVLAMQMIKQPTLINHKYYDLAGVPIVVIINNFETTKVMKTPIRLIPFRI